MGIALQSYSVTADEWTLIASNVSELSFQNIGQFPVYVNFSSAANTEPSSSVGLVYQPGNGELQKSLSELLYATGGDLWYVWCKAISKQSKVLATDGIELLARTIYPDATGKLVLPDEARTTDLYAADHEGVYRKFESGEPAVVGGRVVCNLVPSDEANDFSDASWVVSNVTKVGTVGDGYQINFAANADANIGNTLDGNSYTAAIGSIYIKADAACTLRLRVGAGLISISVTTEWQRFSSARTSENSQIYVFNGVDAAARSVYLKKAQYEDAEGRTDTTTPSEWTDGLAVYSTENGNSVASNVVTEAVGADLSPAPYVLTTPGATNSCAYSQDLTGTGWTTTGLVKAQDATDIFGNPSSAWTIEDDNASAFEIAVYTTSITSSTNTHSVRAWFKKTVSASSFPGLQIRITGGATIDPGVAVNTDNGSLTNWTTAPDSKSIEDDGDYWKVTISVADTGVGNNQLALRIFPAVNTDASTFWDTSTTGSCVFDQAEIFLNTSHAVAHALPPIPTSGSAVTTNDTEVSIDWPSGVVNNSAIIGTVQQPTLAAGGFLDLFVNSNNRFDFLSHTTGSTRLIQRVSGSLENVDDAGGLTANTDYDFRALKAAGGITLFADGSKVGTDADATADIVIPGSGKLYFGRNSSSVTSVGKLRDIQIWSVPASISDAAVLALTP